MPASPTSWCAFDIPGDEKRLAQLEARSSDTALWDNPDAARELMQQLSALRAKVETWRGLERSARDLVEILELAIAEDDSSFEASLSADLAELEDALEEREFALELSGPYDARNAIIAVHAGAGGTESQDWAEMLLRMYIRWAERHGFEVEVLDMTEGEEAGIKSATAHIRGEYAYGYLKSERGVHRLVRLSPFDAAHARHTSFAKVEVMPEVESTAEVEINPDDIRIDVFRSSGAGGQNVQKNSTAVRVLHLPTGIIVTCQNERSQSRNKDTALKVLKSRLLELQLEQEEKEKAKLKGEHVDMAFGNQVRSYVLHPYKMVKDHRTNFETSDAAAVLDGDLDGLMAAYLKSQMGEEP